MTEKEKYRQKFWLDRFTEKLNSNSEKNQTDELRARNSKRFADYCLDQYDITFNDKAQK